MLTPEERVVIRKLTVVLATVCDAETVADLMNATLSLEADERLTDQQVEMGEAFFDVLTDLRPECVELAQQQ